MIKILHKCCLLVSILAVIVGCNSVQDNVELLQSKRSIDRAEAIYWLYHNTEEDTTKKKLLREAAKQDPSPLVRGEAVRLMSISDDKEYLPFIVEALQDPDPIVRMEAAQGIGSLQAIELKDELFKALKKESHLWVKLKILKSIDYMDAKKSVPELIEVLRDDHPGVQFQAAVLLRKFTGKKIGVDHGAWEKWYKSKYDGQKQDKAAM